jgi:hypothetical protein
MRALREELLAPQWRGRLPFQRYGPSPRGCGLPGRGFGLPGRGLGLRHRWCGQPRWDHGWPVPSPAHRPEEWQPRRAGAKWPCLVTPPPPADENLLAALGPPGPPPPSPLPEGRRRLPSAERQQPLPPPGGRQLRSAWLLRGPARRQVRLPAAPQRSARVSPPGQLGALRAAGPASGPPFRPSAGRGQLGLPRCSRSGSSPRSPWKGRAQGPPCW